jgi:hypothetical protein
MIFIIYLFEDFYSDRNKVCAIEVIIVEYILESYRVIKKFIQTKSNYFLY